MHEHHNQQNSITPKMIVFAIGLLCLLWLMGAIIFGSLSSTVDFEFTLENSSDATVTFEIEIADFETDQLTPHERTVKPRTAERVVLKTPAEFDLTIATDQGGALSTPISLNNGGRHIVRIFYLTKDGQISQK